MNGKRSHDELETDQGKGDDEKGEVSEAMQEEVGGGNKRTIAGWT